MNSGFLSNTSAKALGAFYTPQTIAEMLAEWAIRAPDDSILEPSAGEGALLRAAIDASARKFGPDSDLKIVACDIDPRATSSIRQWLNGKHDIRTGDFLALDPTSVGLSRLVLANPPFTRNHALPADYRRALRSRFEVEGAAGIWVHFLAHACTFLARGGRLAAVIPAAATFTQYGRQALTRLCRNFTSVELRTFVDKPVWVNGAEERGAVILADGYKLGACEEARVSRWSTFGSPQAEIHAGNPACFNEMYAASVPLGEIATLSIGAVTGCNRVFLLSERERREAGIELDEVVAIASRARQVRGIYISPEDLMVQGETGEKTWLLSPPDIHRERAGVRMRLASIDKTKRRTTLWLNKRTPWWKVDHPTRCDAVFTYMNDGGPRLVIAKGRLVCTNTLHRVTFLPAITTSQRANSALTMVSTFGQLAAEREGRTYGGGVLKFELSNARSLPILHQPAVKTAELQRVDHALREGKLVEARNMADRLLLPGILGVAWPSAVREMEAELSMLRHVRTGR
jgi:adenine-specific DNA-methyltransferase